MEKYKEIRINELDYVKTINEQNEKGYKFVKEISRTTSERSSPDARGVVYGGETYVKLLFELKQ